MTTDFEIQFDDSGRIIDFLSNQPLVTTPEERVRQRYLRVLHYEYGYPKDRMRREVPIQHGHKEMLDTNGAPIRADIVIYSTGLAARSNDQGKIQIVVECKAPTEKGGYNQLVSYIFNTSAQGGVWFNDSGTDDEVLYYRRLSHPDNHLIPWVGIPRPNETWDSLGRRAKSELVRPRDIKGLLRRCHNKLHGRGTDGEESDLTMDMVRLILAKAMDEEQSEPLPSFYCTPEEYRSSAGQAVVADRVNALFEKVKRANSDVFSQEDRIGVGPRVIADVVIELQDYQLVSPIDAAIEWDIMGHAYEQYTSVHLRRERGQFFTNRLIIDLIVGISDPHYMDIILDPAGGSGGFLTGAMRYVRGGIVGSEGSATAKSRQIDRHRTNLFMVESTKRLVKVAKTAMILNGDGHAGMTAGDSLGDYNSLERSVIARAGRGMPTMILTNPPFAGVGQGRVSDPSTLARFQTAQKWSTVDGVYAPTGELLSGGVPPELLFVERCLDWLAPGGILGIVLPKSFLDTATYRPGRELLFRQTQLLAVINCHKDTFQPHTGTRTCVIVCRKLREGEQLGPYKIFMAISHRIGQNSEGQPIFRRDSVNNLTDEIDQDVTDILTDYRHFRSGNLQPSQYVFAVDSMEIDEKRCINPQMFLPHLNETLNNIERVDQIEGWNVLTLDQLDPEIEVFKGPRLKSENLIVPEPVEGAEPYYTPSAMLQERADSVKWLVTARASASQKAAIDAIRVRRGDIVISRSGSIGRVALITSKYHNAIVSDDLIRVRTKSESRRKFLFAYLQSRYAQDQMMRNEYGAIQQHLEPHHVRNILIPWPDDEEKAEAVLRAAGKVMSTRELLDGHNRDLQNITTSLVDELVDEAKLAEADGLDTENA